MKELTHEEMTSLKGGFFDLNVAAVASLGNAAVSTPVAVNGSGVQLVGQAALSSAGNQLVGIAQFA